MSDRISIFKHPQTPLKRKHPWCGRFFNSAATTTLAPVSVGLHIRLPGTGEFLEFSEFHASPVAFSQGSSPAFAWRPKRMPQGPKGIQRDPKGDTVQYCSTNCSTLFNKLFNPFRWRVGAVGAVGGLTTGVAWSFVAVGRMLRRPWRLGTATRWHFWRFPNMGIPRGDPQSSSISIGFSTMNSLI